jgi:hypothetical protein
MQYLSPSLPYFLKADEGYSKVLDSAAIISASGDPLVLLGAPPPTSRMAFCREWEGSEDRSALKKSGMRNAFGFVAPHCCAQSWGRGAKAVGDVPL